MTMRLLKKIAYTSKVLPRAAWRAMVVRTSVRARLLSSSGPPVTADVVGATPSGDGHLNAVSVAATS
jgi:hypothetical protein